MQRLSPDGFSSVSSGNLIAQHFEILYAYYQEPVKRYLFAKWVHNQEVAAELCQETFTSAWVYFSREGANLLLSEHHRKNLLYKIADDRAIDYLRKTKRSESILLSEIEDELMVQFDIDVRLSIREAIAQLPLKEREYLLTTHIFGFKQKELAAKYGITESAVSQIVKSAEAHIIRKIYPVTIDFKRADASFDDPLFGFLVGYFGKDILKQWKKLKLEQYNLGEVWGYLISDGMPFDFTVSRVQADLARLSKSGPKGEEDARMVNSFLQRCLQRKQDTNH